MAISDDYEWVVTAGTGGSVSGDTSGYLETNEQVEVNTNGATLVLTYSIMGDSYYKTIVATASTGYVFDHWSMNGNTLSDDNTYYLTPNTRDQFVAVFVLSATTSTVQLSTGHTYIVACATSGGIASVSLSGTTLTVTHTSSFDTIDLGAGTGSDSPKIIFATPDGIYGLNDFT